MSYRGRILVVENAETSPLGRFETWWRATGVSFDVVRGHREPLPSLDGYDGLVILGGGFMPDDDAQAPWLPLVRSLVRDALSTELPLLGICLGSQMLAQVAGGEVTSKTGSPEVGSTPVEILRAASDDALFSCLPAQVCVVENHEDMITKLPDSAVLLASTRFCPNQAFRMGTRAWGIQFHPEASAHMVSEWSKEYFVDRGFDPDEVLRKSEEDEPKWEPTWRDFAARFAAIVAQYALSDGSVKGAR